MTKKTTNQNLFLGVDGGATNSTLVLVDEEESKVFKATGEGLNYRVVGKENFIKNFRALLQKIEENLKNRIKGACFGLAGIDNKEDKVKVNSLIKKIPKEILSFSYFLLNDIQIILPSAKIEDGVVAVCGTGSNFFAKKGKKVAFASGLDYILSDQGSAFDMGLKILRSAVKSFDGRGEKTILESLVLKEAGVKNIRELGNFVYCEENLKNKVASFAFLLEKALEENDKVANGILNYVLSEIFSGIKAVSDRAGFKDGFQVVAVGGIFHNRFLVNKMILEAREEFEDAKLTIIPEPEIGAARLAKKNFG